MMVLARGMSENRTGKGLVYEDLQEALEALNAEDRGRYFLCDCPECQEHEAFIYKNNTSFISCNRENECGETIQLSFRERLSEVDVAKLALAESYPELTEEQVDALDWMNRATRHLQTYVSTKTFEQGYRGVSEEVAKEFVADFFSEDMVGFMFEKVKPLVGKDYSKNDWMRKRNLVFPIRGEDEEVERILLRSSYAELEPKEIQLIVNPSKDTRDFFVDIPESAQTIVIAEAIFDGMSFREVDSHVGVIALTGARKLRKVSEFLQDNKERLKDKNILVAMDNDTAGWQATDKLVSFLEKENIGKHWDTFITPRRVLVESGKMVEITDPNDFLQHNRDFFSESYRDCLNGFQKRNMNIRGRMDQGAELSGKLM